MNNVSGVMEKEKKCCS